MKPENHAIRQLEKHLENATPKEREAIERVIAGLEAVLSNKSDPPALFFAQTFLADEVRKLGELMKPNERT